MRVRVEMVVVPLGVNLRVRVRREDPFFEGLSGWN